MKMKNVKVREEDWIRLMMIKYNLGKATVAEVIEELLKRYKKKGNAKFSLLVILILFALPLAFADLSCSIGTSCGDTDLFHISNLTNAHTELSNESNYNYKICCYDTEGVVGTGCSGGYVNVLLKLSNTTNAHAELGSESNYNYVVCMNTTQSYDCVYDSYCSGTYDTCIASVSNIESSRTTSLHVGDCSAYSTKICCREEVAGLPENRVALSMEFNVSGYTNDVAEADSLGTGYYDKTAIDDYYICLNDPSLSNNPTFGNVFSGKEFYYINLSSGDSYKMKLGQYGTNNKFIIPVTTGGCDKIREKMDIIKSRGILTQPFVDFVEGQTYPAELTLSYPNVDIVGDFTKSGSFVLTFEKTEDEIIIRSV